MKYNPIWNVDGVTGTIHQESHTGTDTDKKTGDVKNTGSSSTTSAGKSVTTDNGSSSTTKSGSESDEPTGKDIVEVSNTTFDDDTYEGSTKTETSFDTRKDTHTYTNVKDTYEVDPNNPIKSTYEVDSQNPLKETYLVDDANPLKETYNTELKKTLNLKDEILDMQIRQGNIGVTSTQSLLQQQLALTELDDIISYAIHDFVHRYLVIIS